MWGDVRVHDIAQRNGYNGKFMLFFIATKLLLIKKARNRQQGKLSPWSAGDR